MLVFPETRVAEALDHIVPKSGKDGWPAWTHLPINLVLACWVCNSRLKKQHNPFRTGRQSPYRSRNFDFVHPYLDFPDRHILGGFDERSGPPRVVQAISEKGKRTIELFELSDPRMFQTWQTERMRMEIDFIKTILPKGRVQQRDSILMELRNSLTPGKAQ